MSTTAGSTRCCRTSPIRWWRSSHHGSISAEGSTPLAHYESSRSPLDLGAEQGRIAAGTRVSYVPAAALVVRVDALRAIGGFDESLRIGEDVDLVWRLDRRRPPLPLRARRRLCTIGRDRHCWRGLASAFGYGRSAASLDHKHPGAVAPLRMSGWSAAVWALVFARRPIAALAVARRNHRCPAPQARRPPAGGIRSVSPVSDICLPAASSRRPSPASGGPPLCSPPCSCDGRDCHSPLRSSFHRCSIG